MKQDKAFELAAAIVRLVNDLEKEFEKDIQELRARGNQSGYYMSRSVNYRNWNDTCVNALPTNGFMAILWADVFGVSPSVAPIRSSQRVDNFVDAYRETIAEWELLGSVGD